MKNVFQIKTKIMRIVMIRIMCFGFLSIVCTVATASHSLTPDQASRYVENQKYLQGIEQKAFAKINASHIRFKSEANRYDSNKSIEDNCRKSKVASIKWPGCAIVKIQERARFKLNVFADFISTKSDTAAIWLSETLRNSIGRIKRWSQFGGKRNSPPTTAGIHSFSTSSGQFAKYVISTSSPITDADGHVVSVEWNFGDGSTMRIPANEVDIFGTVRHVFPGAGTYSVVLRIYDNEDEYSEYSQNIEVTFNQVPSPNFSYTTESGTTINFTGIGNDPENAIVEYTWNFNDGTPPVSTGASNLVSHQFPQSGIFNVDIIARDDAGAVGFSSKTVYVGQSIPNDAPPIVIPKIDSVFAYAPATIQFDGTLSAGNSGEGIESYKWDFGDLDSSTNISSSPTPSHIYKRPGTYIGRLVVTSVNGSQNTKYFEIHVAGAAIGDPIIFAEQVGNDREVNFNQTPWSITGTAELGDYRWDLGDGNIKIEMGPRHKYLLKGTYSVSVVVRDLQGFRKKATQRILVDDENNNPIAIAKVDQKVTQTGQVANFFGDESSDSTDGDNLIYTWNFGDGDILHGPSYKNVSHAFQARGLFATGLFVTNSRGFSAASLVEVSVQNGNLLKAEIYSNPQIGEAPLAVSFNQQISSNVGIEKFIWKFHDGSVHQGYESNKVYSQPGIYPVQLYVMDNLGNESVVRREIVVLDPNNIPVENHAPIAKISVAYSNNSYSNSLRFSGYDSLDSDDDKIFYEWKNVENNSILSTAPEFSYPWVPGTHTIQLTVRDQWNAASVDTRRFNVSYAPAPELSMDFSPTRPVKLDIVYFTSNGSAVNGVDPSKYKWDFGDGKFAFGENPKHVYASAGTYNVKLSAIDLSGSKWEGSIDVTVEEPVGPTPFISAENDTQTRSVSTGSNQSYVVSSYPENIRFSMGRTATQRLLADGSWDFGDGSTGFGHSVEHTYHKPGVYTVTATALDSGGLSGTTTMTVVVNEKNCELNESQTACFHFDNGNSNILPLTASSWNLTSTKNLNFSNEPENLMEGWIKLVTEDGPGGVEEYVDISDIVSVNGATINLSQSGLMAKNIDFTRRYRVFVNTLSDMNELLVGSTSELVFGVGTLNLNLEEGGIRLKITNTSIKFAKYYISGSSGTISSTELPLGIYDVEASKGGTSINHTVTISGSTPIDVNISLSQSAIQKRLAQIETQRAKARRIQAENLEKLKRKDLDSTAVNGGRSVTHPVTGITWSNFYMGACGQAPPFKLYDKTVVSIPGYKSEGFSILSTKDPGYIPELDIFRPISNRSSGVVRVRCFATTTSTTAEFDWWKYVTSRCRDQNSPVYDLLLEKISYYSRDNEQITLKYEVRDTISGVIQPGSFSTSAASLISEVGTSRSTFNTNRGYLPNGTGSGNSLFLTKVFDVQIPQTFKKAEIKFTLDAPFYHPPVQEDGYFKYTQITSCNLIVPEDQKPVVKGITSSASSTARVDRNAGASLARNLFPVQVDTSPQSPVTVDANIFKARYIFEIDNNAFPNLHWTGADVVMTYNGQSTVAKFFPAEPNSRSVEYGTNLVKVAVVVDAQQLAGTFNSYAYDSEGVLVNDVDLTFTLKNQEGVPVGKPFTKTFQPMFNGRDPGHGTVCKNSFYSSQISAFGQPRLLETLKRLSASGADLRCNDFSLPFGGEFYIKKDWAHDTHRDGLIADLRYPDPTLQFQDAYDQVPLLPKNVQLPIDNNLKQRRLRDVEEYYKFSKAAKEIATGVPDNSKWDLLMQFCENKPVCQNIGSSPGARHLVVLKLCQVNIIEPGFPQGTCPLTITSDSSAIDRGGQIGGTMANLDRFKRFSEWVANTTDGFSKIEPFAKNVIFSKGSENLVGLLPDILPGEVYDDPIFKSIDRRDWQSLALLKGEWPPQDPAVREPIFRVVGNVVVDEELVPACVVGSTLLQCKAPNKIKFYKGHFHHFHLGI